MIALLAWFGLACAPPAPAVGPPDYDVIVRHGQLYDGTGAPPVHADLAIRDDRIVAIGDLGPATAHLELDATGLAVAPGFINTLSSWPAAVLLDPLVDSELRQGVTLEIFGEGFTMAPLNDALKQELRDRKSPLESFPWSTLGELLAHLESSGIGPNVASLVGASTVRAYVVGQDDRAPTAEELAAMQALVREAMHDGALGLGSALIYPPGAFASTDELVALAEAAAEHDGIYASHLRSEGAGLIAGLDELLEIARRTGIRAEVYHLKAAGRENWPALDTAIARIEAARADGLEITANIYPYTAAATGLTASVPPWIQQGGLDAFMDRLVDPEDRARALAEMADPASPWENFFQLAGGAEGVTMLNFHTEALAPYTGRTLADVAAERGQPPLEVILDLIHEDRSRITTVYEVMSEANVRKKLALPWVSVCSDASMMSEREPFTAWTTHPRAYGSFARVLGHYARDEAVLPLPEAIRRMTSLPADTYRLRDRGRLQVGAFADVVVFDPGTVQDHATYQQPKQYASGVQHVLVNGVPVVHDGARTEATPGVAVRGPGSR